MVEGFTSSTIPPQLLGLWIIFLFRCLDLGFGEFPHSAPDIHQSHCLQQSRLV